MGGGAASPSRVVCCCCCSTQRAHAPDPQAREPLSLWTEVWPVCTVRSPRCLFTGKKTPGEPGHTRDTRNTRTHKGTQTTQTNLTTIETHQQRTPRTSARRPKPRPTKSTRSAIVVYGLGPVKSQLRAPWRTATCRGDPRNQNQRHGRGTAPWLAIVADFTCLQTAGDAVPSGPLASVRQGHQSDLPSAVPPAGCWQRIGLRHTELGHEFPS